MGVTTGDLVYMSTDWVCCGFSGGGAHRCRYFSLRNTYVFLLAAGEALTVGSFLFYYLEVPMVVSPSSFVLPRAEAERQKRRSLSEQDRSIGKC